MIEGDASGLCAVFVSLVPSGISAIVQYCHKTMPRVVPKYLVPLSTKVWPFWGSNAVVQADEGEGFFASGC